MYLLFVNQILLHDSTKVFFHGLRLCCEIVILYCNLIVTYNKIQSLETLTDSDHNMINKLNLCKVSHSIVTITVFNTFTEGFKYDRLTLNLFNHKALEHTLTSNLTCSTFCLLVYCHKKM